MKNRAQLNFTSVGMALLFVSIFAIFLGTYMGGLLIIFPGSDLNVTSSATYNKLTTMANLSEDLSGKVGQTSTTDESFDVKVYKAGFSAIKLIFYDGPTLIAQLLNTFTTELGVPSWVVGFCLACVVLPLAILVFNVFIRSFIKL